MLITRKGLLAKSKPTKGGGGGGGTTNPPVNTSGWYIPLIDPNFNTASPTLINRDTNTQIAMTAEMLENRTRIRNSDARMRGASYSEDDIYLVSKRRDTYSVGRYVHPLVCYYTMQLVITGEPWYADRIAEIATNISPNYIDGWLATKKDGTAQPTSIKYEGVMNYASDTYENMVDIFQGDDIYGKDIAGNELHMYFCLCVITWAMEVNRGQVSPAGYNYGQLADRFYYLTMQTEKKWYKRRGRAFPDFPLGANRVQMWSGHLKSSMQMSIVEERRGNAARAKDYRDRCNRILTPFRTNNHEPPSSTKPYPGGWIPYQANGVNYFLWCSGSFGSLAGPVNTTQTFSPYVTTAEYMTYSEQFFLYYMEAAFLLDDPQCFTELRRFSRTIARYCVKQTPAQMSITTDENNRPFHNNIAGLEDGQRLGIVEAHITYYGKHYRGRPSYGQITSRSYPLMGLFDDTGIIDPVLQRAYELWNGSNQHRPISPSFPAYRLFKLGRKALLGV